MSRPHVITCELCSEPAVRELEGFDWCQRHAENLEAVQRGEKFVPEPARVDVKPRVRGRSRRAQAIALLKKGASTVPELSNTLGWSLETTRGVLRDLHREGRIIKKQAGTPSAAKHRLGGRSRIVFSLGRSRAQVAAP